MSRRIVRRLSWGRLAGATLLVVLVAIAMARPPRSQHTVSAGAPGSPVATIRTLTADGGRVDWSHAGDDRIAFDRKGDDGYFDVYTMNPDGSAELCLTCEHPALPHRNQGQPAWH